MTEKKYYGDVLLRPLITEKTVASGELNKYNWQVEVLEESNRYACDWIQD
ncbi:MAG: 50S ribosomal protein L23 [Mesotoga infera]|uniref:50S ribosomal protein L23 n=1 Tax=Mesotoga infera TaxID=1236046 RepID=A0A101GX94_9BACT|nr:MAG: 50S ribosomal protein L23 [Mesotoga infera]